MDLSSLNERQLQAVQWKNGPLLVLAGPGSGKTTVLTTRIAKLIEETAEQHFRILGLTFTNKAAAEMRKRIDLLVPGASQRFLLTTFHSFAGDLLRQHGHLIGLKPDFAILSQDGERIAVMDEAISSLAEKIDTTNVRGEQLLPVVNRIIENNVSDEAHARIFGAMPDERRELVELVYTSYRKRLIESNSLDFPSMISEALNLLKQIPVVARQTRRIYKYVCVDEFQDTNLSQYMILRALVSDTEKNLFVVADDDQIIYQWNGASPERLLGLRDDFGLNIVQLPANYRCPPHVVDLANKLIAHNTSRTVNKDSLLALKAAGNSEAVRLFAFSEFDEEAKWIAHDIASKSPKDRSRCVVLARTRKTLEVAVTHLAAAGVPAYLAMRKDEFVSAPLRWLHAALKLTNNPQDRDQLRRLTRAFYDLEGIQADPIAVAANAKAFEGSALRSFAELVLRRDKLTPATKSYLSLAVPKLTDRLDYRAFCSASFQWFEAIQGVLPDTQGHFAEYSDEQLTWHALNDEIEGQFGAAATTLNVLVQELDMRSKTPPPPRDAVPCFTIHASKGMEFGFVYLIGMVEDQLPSWAAVKKGAESQEIQEERRNCFVAITRTEDELTMTFSQRMFGWAKLPSRFLTEMGFQV